MFEKEIEEMRASAGEYTTEDIAAGDTVFTNAVFLEWISKYLKT